MGWCSGSYLAEDVWQRIKEYIPETEKRSVAGFIVDIFEEYDADCWCDIDNSDGVWATGRPEEYKEYINGC